VVVKENLAHQAARKEEIFRRHLVHPAIRAVSGCGLFLSVAFESEAFNYKVISHCMKKGVITDWFLFASHKMRIAPPLIISDDEIVHACHAICESIDEVLRDQ
jgi:4-aminobutyrate aminotransferase-like enzyme